MQMDRREILKALGFAVAGSAFAPVVLAGTDSTGAITLIGGTGVAGNIGFLPKRPAMVAIIPDSYARDGTPLIKRLQIG